MVTELAIVAVATIVLGLLVPLISPNKTSNKVLSTVLLTFALTIIYLGVVAFPEPRLLQLPPPFYLGLAPFSFYFDQLSSIFLVLLGTLTAAVSLYIPGYLKHHNGSAKSAAFWINLFLFVLAMASVVVAANALTFLLYWELMSLSSALLVAQDLKTRSGRRAAFIYAGATRLATAFLAVGFLAFGNHFQSWNFADWHPEEPALLIPSILVLLGLAIKAGLWPFHIWLPYAHPAAPSPVSALMSGFMIKTAIYAILRIFVLNTTLTPAVALVLLCLGTISAVWGSLFALVQEDLKKVLAYSSVENIGLITVALATSMYARTAGNHALADLAMVAAVLHCLNHGVFKALLFLCAGSVDIRTHTRLLSRLGGLGWKMPSTMLLFVAGCACICALPPTNGFASKWLIYQSLFKSLSLSFAPTDQEPTRLLFALVIGCLALTSGLTIAGYTRVAGMVFLGRPRSNDSAHAREADREMILAKTILAGLCLGLGIVTPSLANLFNIRLLPILPLPVIAVFLLLTVLLLYLLGRAAKERGECRRVDSWECGYGSFNGRTQISPESFSQPVAYLFRPILLYRMSSDITGADRRHFPDKIRSETSMKSLLETSVYKPIVNLFVNAGKHLARLQAGSVHMYLLYVLSSLVGLLLAGALL